MSILVLTATGKVGSQIVEQLHKAGVDFAAGTRDTEKAKEELPDGVETVRFDYADEYTFDAALDGTESVFLNTTYGPDAYNQTKAFVERCRESSVKKIVLMSAMGVEHIEGPMRDYELSVINSGLDYVILRPTWFFQNFNTMFLATIIHMGGIYLPFEDAKVSYVDTRDIAACAVKGLTTDELNGKELTVTGPEGLTLYQVANTIGEAALKPVNYVPITDEQMREAMVQQAGITDENYLNLMKELAEQVRSGSVAGATSHVKDATGNDPIDIEKYANDYAGYWR